MLFGRQTDKDGLFSKIWIDIKLPNTGIFECFDELKMTGLINELTSMTNNIENPQNFSIVEKNSILRVKEIIERLKICCYSGGRFNQRNGNLDTSQLFFEVDIDNSCTPFKEGDATLIYTNPAMPSIGFKLEYFGDTICTSLNAELRIKFQRKVDEASRNRDDSIQLYIDPVDFSYFYYFDLEDTFQGGRAEIIIYDQFDVFVKSFKFSIKGLNPTTRSVFEYLGNKGYIANYWFLEKMAVHESNSDPKRLNHELKQFNFYDPMREDLWKDWNEFSRCPVSMGDPNNPDLVDNDGGWGLMQLTNDIPSKEMLWNWKFNIDEAYNRLHNTKRITAKNKVINDLNKVNTWNTNNLDSLVVHLDTIYANYNWKYSITPTLNNESTIVAYFNQTTSKSNEKSFLDACLMLAYNGYGGNKINGVFVNFLYVHQATTSDKPEWRILDNEEKYVRKISKTNVPVY